MACSKITERTIDGDVDVTSFDNIRVICRFRPPNRRELEYSKKKKVPDQPPEFESDQTIKLSRATAEDGGKQSRHKSKPFRCSLDSIVKPGTSQKEVFYLVGQPMILSCLQGYNATIFAYGQSGSGILFKFNCFNCPYSECFSIFYVISILYLCSFYRKNIHDVRSGE